MKIINIEKYNERKLEGKIIKALESYSRKNIGDALNSSNELLKLNENNPYSYIGIGAYKYITAPSIINNQKDISQLESSLKLVKRGLKIDSKNKYGLIYKLLILDSMAYENPSLVGFFEFYYTAKKIERILPENGFVLEQLYNIYLNHFQDASKAGKILEKLTKINPNKYKFHYVSEQQRRKSELSVVKL